MMAIVRALYIRSGSAALNRQAAKRAIRYIQARPGRDGARVVRDLWNSQGRVNRHDFYRRIDNAAKGTIFYKIFISPDAATEDPRRDLHLREITEGMMVPLSDRVVTWAAAVHDDHAPHRHVNLLVITKGRLNVPELTILREKASQECREQRRELEQARTRFQERRGEWERAADSYSRG